MLPAASRATAVSVCVPLVAVAVFQLTEYGLVVSSAPRFTPSSRNCTPTTPTLSEALAETVTVPVTVAPLAGAVIETVGAVVSRHGHGDRRGRRRVAGGIARDGRQRMRCHWPPSPCSS